MGVALEVPDGVGWVGQQVGAEHSPPDCPCSTPAGEHVDFETDWSPEQPRGSRADIAVGTAEAARTRAVETPLIRTAVTDREKGNEMEIEVPLAYRVTAGARWLDENYPDWYQHVNTFTLDMGNGDKCILGQVGRALLDEDKIPVYMHGFSKYVQLLDTHDLDWDFPATHGFCWEAREREPFPAEAYQVWMRAVTLLWISEVNSRVAVDHVPVGA